MMADFVTKGRIDGQLVMGAVDVDQRFLQGRLRRVNVKAVQRKAVVWRRFQVQLKRSRGPREDLLGGRANYGPVELGPMSVARETTL